MSNGKELQVGGQLPSFHGSPVFNAPVLFNSVWNAQTSVPSKADENDDIFQDDEIDANVEECSLNDYEDSKGAENVYPITSHPKGRILILNNEFKNAALKRKGSDLDVKNMMVLWQSLGFAIEIVSDLTAEGMQQAVKDFVTSQSMIRANICAILVMSHGEEDDFIVGDKHTKLSVMNIVDEVKKSEILHGKPKLLFFQMCRGAKTEKYKPHKPGSKEVESDAMPITEDAEQSDSVWFRDMLDTLLSKTKSKHPLSATKPDGKSPAPRSNDYRLGQIDDHVSGRVARYEYGNASRFGTQAQSIGSRRIERDGPGRIESDGPGQIESDGPGQIESDGPGKIESDASAFEYTDHGGEDLMIAFATKPDHVAFRGQEGSWFVTAIARQFKEHAKDHDVIELMDFVKDDVCKKRSYTTRKPKYHDCVAAVEQSHTFGKKLYFFPGYPTRTKDREH